MTAPGPVRHRRVRDAIAGVLVVLASVLLPLGLVTVWLHSEVLDTNAFVSAAGRVARDPAVRREVSDKVGSALIDQLDVDANVHRAARSVLPGAARALGGPLSVGADRAIRTATTEVVASDRFEQLWEVAVRNAHENALLLARGHQVAGVETRNGRISINLDPIVDAVVAQLPGPVAALVPPITTGDDIVLFGSSELATAQPFMRAVEDGWWVPPLLSVALFASAVAVASRRRRAVSWVGGGIVISSVVTFAALLIGRERVVDAVDAHAARAAIRVVSDAVFDPLRSELWVTAGIGVALVAASIVLGFLAHPHPHPSPSPVATTEPVAERTDPPLPGTEPTSASHETMPSPDRSSGQPAEPIREATSSPRAPS